MINFNFNEHCCGCSSCANICPVDAIKMNKNEEGFLIPSVDTNLCINCNKCDKTCPYLNTTADINKFSLSNFYNKKAYLFYSNSERRKDSASGGFVYEAMLTCLNEEGVICGCVWNENMEAIHIISNKLEDLYRMQSSKYVQSNLGDCYSKIKTHLKEGKKVVFCGTPCQTVGLHSYLKNTDMSNLLSICLICHGTASPKAWEKWVQVMEKKYHGRLINVNMRDKSYKGYKTSYSKYTFSINKPPKHHSIKYIGLPTYLGDPYIFLFTDNLFLRPSCYKCQYKADQNRADIIVGDFHPSIKEAGNLGCSSVIPMTEKGDQYINKINGILRPTKIETIGNINTMLWESVNENKERHNFFHKLQNSKSGDITPFTSFLPAKYYIKKSLNTIGLFNIIKNILK